MDFPGLTDAQLRALRRVAFAERGYRPAHDPQVRQYLVELRDLGLLFATTTGTTGRKVLAPTPTGIDLLRAAWRGEYRTRPAVQALVEHLSATDQGDPDPRGC